MDCDRDMIREIRKSESETATRCVRQENGTRETNGIMQMRTSRQVAGREEEGKSQKRRKRAGIQALQMLTKRKI